MVNYEELEKLQELKNSGGITEQEFEVEKYKILHNSNNTNTSNNTKVIYITSLIFGICALIFGIVPIWGLILSVVSLIISIVSKKKLKEENGKSGLVTAGFVLSILGSIIALCITILIPLAINTTLGSNGIIGKAKEVEQNSNNIDFSTSENIETPNLLEEIYKKYPDLRGEGSIVCHDEDNYWLLDKEGKKVYFYDLESFENALRERNTTESTENNTEITNHTSVEHNNNENYNNNNYDNDTNTSNNKEQVFINDIDVSKMSETEIKKEFEKRGLNVKIEKTTKQIGYLREEVGTTESYILSENYKAYNKGDTIRVNMTIYEAEPIKIRFKSLGTSGYYGGYYRHCYLTENVNNAGKKGTKVYFNNKLVYSGDDGEFSCTYTKNEKIHIKIIAPYLYDCGDNWSVGKTYTKDVTLLDVTTTVQELDKDKLYYGFNGEVCLGMKFQHDII